MSQNKIKGAKRKGKRQIVLNAVFIIICACYILPFMMIISISLSSANSIYTDGFRLFPKEIDLTAWKIVLSDLSKILQAYKVTISYSFLHTILVVVVTALLAYPLSKRYLKGRTFLTWYVFFTMLFGAGMIPTFLSNSKYLGLYDNFWVYVLPGTVSAWNVMVMRTSYSSLPEEMLEAAKIDGAGEFKCFYQIVAPLSKPTYATIGFLTLVGSWNNWNTSLIYIREPKLYSLQYLLQTMLRSAEELEQMAQTTLGASLELPPTEPMRFAMALVAAGPVLLVFPFFQKYFTKGMMVGSVKG